MGAERSTILETIFENDLEEFLESNAENIAFFIHENNKFWIFLIAKNFGHFDD